MEQEELTLEELSDRAFLPARIVRSYIEQGLLRGPSSKGRYARYGDYHLKRLLAIRALRDQNLSLADIRRQLLSMSDDDIARIGATASTTGAQTTAPRGSALEYLRGLAEQSLERTDAQLDNSITPSSAARRRLAGQSAPPLTKGPETSNPFERLLVALQRSLAMRRVDRQAHGETWFRIAVTPDIELHVRGALSPEAQATMERLSDYLREVALGGPGPTPPP